MSESTTLTALPKNHVKLSQVEEDSRTHSRISEISYIVLILS